MTTIIIMKAISIAITGLSYLLPTHEYQQILLKFKSLSKAIAAGSPTGMIAHMLSISLRSGLLIAASTPAGKIWVIPISFALDMIEELF
jgi:hypothetical protein